MRSGRPIITLLTREVALVHVLDLVELDRPAVRDGKLEAWESKHFLAELPHKWQLSSVALVADQPIGYRVVSGNGLYEGYAHSHRTMVAPDSRRMGIARQLLENCSRLAKAHGYVGLTGKCHPDNDVSQAWLAATGWELIEARPGINQIWRLGPWM